MLKPKFYIVSERYIDYLRSDERLDNVCKNKDGKRKYVGTALEINGFSYFVPLSSPKDKDYRIVDGEKKLKGNSPFAFHLLNKNNQFIASLKIGNMIPVPKSELQYYDFSKVNDNKYRDLLNKEYRSIIDNADKITKLVSVAYRQVQMRKLVNAGLEIKSKLPNYVKDMVDYEYAEQKCLVFQQAQRKQSVYEEEKADILDLTKEPDQSRK